MIIDVKEDEQLIFDIQREEDFTQEVLQQQAAAALLEQTKETIL